MKHRSNYKIITLILAVFSAGGVIAKTTTTQDNSSASGFVKILARAKTREKDLFVIIGRRTFSAAQVSQHL